MYKSENPKRNLPEAFARQVEQVSDYQIDELILLVSHRFNQLRPDRECSILALSKDPARRRREIEALGKEL